MCATILELRGSLSRYRSLTGLWRSTKASSTLGNLREEILEPHLEYSCNLKKWKIKEVK
jgi:hypothetical protein